MWLGAAPYKPYHTDRVHYKNCFYWGYEGGDLTNFGAHSMDPLQWTCAKDDTGPVRIEPYAPWPQHPDAVGPYGWVELTYADGLKVIVTGGRWGKKYDRPKKRGMVAAKAPGSGLLLNDNLPNQPLRCRFFTPVAFQS